MLGFPPPCFFQICWRFISPTIIFVSSLLVPPLLPHGEHPSLGNQQGRARAHPLGQSSPWGSTPTAQVTGSLSEAVQGQTGVETQNHPSPGLGLGMEHRALYLMEDSAQLQKGKIGWPQLRAGPPSLV